MLDIDYCNGYNCSKKEICQRYADFLFRREQKLDIKYARNGVKSDCEQFDLKRFTGN